MGVSVGWCVYARAPPSTFWWCRSVDWQRCRSPRVPANAGVPDVQVRPRVLSPKGLNIRALSLYFCYLHFEYFRSYIIPQTEMMESISIEGFLSHFYNLFWALFPQYRCICNIVQQQNVSKKNAEFLLLSYCRPCERII